MRYAIYFTPATSDPLWQFGCCVLGYDAASGEDVAFPGGENFEALPLADWTSEPRRYGFHATLKAPFELAEGRTVAQLLACARTFSACRQGFTLPPLALLKLGRFLALTPSAPSASLQQLAGDCVRDFDSFRAPLTPQDRARRLAHPLPARQLQHLERWGYPYVFDDFTFHMTLSGGLPEPDRSHFQTALCTAYEPYAQPLIVDAIAVFAQQNRDARFRLVQRFPFG